MNSDYQRHLDKGQIIAFLSSHKDVMRERFGVVKIGLFGSFARGEQKPVSDIDIAVEMETDHIFRKFFALEQYLREHLNRDIDLGIESTLKPAAKQRIMQEIVYA
ncbi:MAG: nucleotidyltransferase family protein [Desulfatirhabdiaceae bacterium]